VFTGIDGNSFATANAVVTDRRASSSTCRSRGINAAIVCLYTSKKSVSVSADKVGIVVT